MTIPIYRLAHLTHAEEMANLASDLGLEVTLYCNSAAARDGALERGLAVSSSNENIGFGRAANLSVEGKDFDWLIVCNDDLVVLRSEFARYIGTLRDRPVAEPWLVGLLDAGSPQRYRIPGVAGVFTNLSLLDAIYVRVVGALPGRKRREPHPEEGSDLVELGKGEAFPFICVAINRSAWRALGGFDPRFDLYFEDMDFLIRSSRLTDAHIAVMPARIHHLGSASTREHLATTLPVFAWSAYQYLTLHTWLNQLGARFLVATAVALRLVFVPVASSSPRADHVVGIAKSLAAILSNKRPRLPEWQS